LIIERKSKERPADPVSSTGAHFKSDFDPMFGPKGARITFEVADVELRQLMGQEIPRLDVSRLKLLTGSGDSTKNERGQNH
jgi:hypothetical protein